jgi:hypothetical protein
MYGRESPRERPSSDESDRVPRGPLGPRRRPTSWAAGMAPFGRCVFALTPKIEGRSPGNITTLASHYIRTPLDAGTFTPTGALATPRWVVA